MTEPASHSLPQQLSLSATVHCPADPKVGFDYQVATYQCSGLSDLGSPATVALLQSNKIYDSSDTRSRLLPEHAEQLIFVKVNLAIRDAD